MRLDKFLSINGIGSRKEVRLLIKKKMVTVNDNIITDASLIIDLESDVISYNNNPITFVKNIYYMMNKPAGYICEHNPVEYPSVLELLNTARKDLFFVGRLDADTEGLLLITNDGQFSHQVSHGKRDITKQYEVHLEKPFNKNYINELEAGIPLDGVQLKPAHVKIVDEHTILLTISEGKYHQVKRMMHYCENQVVYLKRQKIGSLHLDKNLDLGESRQLTQSEMNLLIPNYKK